MAGMGFFWGSCWFCRVGVAGTCDPHVCRALAKEACCALVESLVLNLEPASFFVVLQGSSLGPVLVTGVFLGFWGKNA